MPLIIKTQFESAVTKANEDIFTKSYLENNNTILEFDTRKRNYKKKLEAKSKIRWNDIYTVDIKELSTLYCPIVYRFIIGQGNYYDVFGERKFFTPEVEEISVSQHVSKSVVRLSSYLAVNCGVSLRNISIIFTYLFLITISKSSIKRWIDDIGSNLPSDENLLKQMIDLKKPTECHIDGYYPMGTDNCVMVVKDEHDRILITHEADSENKDDAIQFLTKIKGLGIEVVSAFSDYSKSFTEAIKQVYPNAKFQADHFHTMKNIWKHLKKAFLEFRREVKEDVNNYKVNWKKQRIEELAQKLWDLRWIVLKKPCNLNDEEQKQLKSLEEQDTYGFVNNFRSIIKSIVSIFDKSETVMSAKSKLQYLRRKVNAEDNVHYSKIINFLHAHWPEATHYLKEGGPERRASNSESGMRLLRRLEKNHDGIRSETTRKNYIKIYQVIHYMRDSDIANFIDNPLPDT
jgi:hypothetical protein